MGALAPAPDPGITLSCSLGACRACSRPLTCTRTCHRKEKTA